MSNPDNYYDPPDEIEAEYCEHCGKEMEYHQDRLDKKTLDIWWKCTNEFCPEKWTSEIVHNMANHLAEVEQELADAKCDLEYANARITNLKTRLGRLESQLTPSQSDVVVRDTDYAIKMVEDAIEYAYLECGMNGDGRRAIWLSWAEAKKILQQGE